MRGLPSVLLMTLFLSPVDAQVEFTVAQTLDLSSTTPGLYGDYLCLVDVTGDGARDLLIIDSSSLVAYEHQSGGAFVELAATPLAGPGTLATVGDLNNDGNTDAVVRLANGYASMLGDGVGGFTQAGIYQTPDDLGQVLVGDFNGDGVLDAVAARGTGGTLGGGLVTELDVRLGIGDGTFGVTNRSDLDGGLNSPVVIDLNEDGTDDVVLAGLFQLTFAFVTDGVVVSSVDYPAGVGDAPQDIRVEDLNGDGHLDVAFTCPLLDRVGVLILDGSGGLGSFTDYEVGATPVTLRPGDINDDGIPDLLTTTDVGLEWRLGFGDGSFGDSDSVALATTDARFAVGDATSDGLAEVAILSGTSVSVLLNTTLASGQPGEFRRGDADLDGEVLINDAVYTLEALFLEGSQSLECADSGDANDDGLVDLSDPIFLINYLFVPAAAAPPPPSGGSCGADPTADSLVDCGAIGSCP